MSDLQTKSFWTAFQEDDGAWSWARLYSTFTGISALWAFWHVVFYTGKIPDASTLVGLAGWAIHGYGVNKAITAVPDTWGKKA